MSIVGGKLIFDHCFQQFTPDWWIPCAQFSPNMPRHEQHLILRIISNVDMGALHFRGF